MLLNEAGRVFVEPWCWRLTDPGVVHLRRAVGMDAILCFFLEVFDHFMQGGHRHLRRTEQCFLPSLFHIFYILLSVTVAQLFQPCESIGKIQVK